MTQRRNFSVRYRFTKLSICQIEERFLKSIAAPAAAVTAFPTIIPGTALGFQGAVPPSDRVTLATIGVGWMGGSHVDIFLKNKNVHYVAVCDVDDAHAAEYKAKIDKAFGSQDCVTYRAFEELLSRKDIDAVSIGVPDHWHGIVSFSAARAGKDIYCEKPLAHNFAEGHAAAEAAARYNRIWQTGSWQRSTANFRQACELVRNGRIGKVRRVEVGLPGGWSDFAKTKDQMQVADPPPGVNYDRWIGPAHEMPFIMARFHKNWRWNLDTGGGQLMDWVGHHVDIAHWGMDWDNTGPLEISGKGEYPDKQEVWNTAGKYSKKSASSTRIGSPMAPTRTSSSARRPGTGSRHTSSGSTPIPYLLSMLSSLPRNFKSMANARSPLSFLNSDSESIRFPASVSPWDSIDGSEEEPSSKVSMSLRAITAKGASSETATDHPVLPFPATISMGHSFSCSSSSASSLRLSISVS